MAVGPTLGTGLFIGAGQALAVGGPASLLISYVLLSLLTYSMATSAAEVASYMPSRHGTMVTNGYLYMSSSLGFAAAYLRWYSMAMLVPYEISSAMVNLGLWNPGSTVAIRMCIITTIIVGFNFLPERLFRGSEHIFTRIKIGTMISLLVLSLSIGLGGATGHDRWGFKYWRNPGAMREYLTTGGIGRFWGLFQCLLDSSIAFTFAPELIVHRAETPELTRHTEATEGVEPNTRFTIPSRVVTDVVQTAFPYILSSLAMGVMAPCNDPMLTNNGTGAGLSPFLIGLNAAQIRIVPVMAMIAILLSSVASGRSFLYLSSRMLFAMSELGHAPAWLKRRNRWDVPYAAVAMSASFCSLAFLSAGISSSVVSNYFLRFVAGSGYLSWLVSCTVYRHFRQRMKANRITDRYRFSVQPFATYLGMGSSAVLLAANGLSAAAPGILIGPRVVRMFTAYFGIAVFGCLYGVHRFQFLVPRRWRRSNEPNGGEERGHGSAPERRTQVHARAKSSPDPEISQAFELQPTQAMATEA
ncbi:hypothetical protein NUU61_010021 [Penicillium alfredii]|uniref:Amino acid permease/ SLC12A domain-containing protein n=1 Tax=Penicillium alfredii TaxID=1506179 RepID=A0A9W9EHD4_9EURO|nr:uncharacterized protein NUU61_010021 [Penicillium alfredii]KAJ5081757.1 hypothetical protein NUU61_010021 [Penicillium alfredii]